MNKVTVNGQSVDFDIAEAFMAESIIDELYECMPKATLQELADAYCDAHLECFGSKFEVL